MNRSLLQSIQDAGPFVVLEHDDELQAAISDGHIRFVNITPKPPEGQFAVRLSLQGRSALARPEPRPKRKKSTPTPASRQNS